MEQSTGASMARIKPLVADAQPELKDTLQTYGNLLGYVPNSVRIMQHKPALVKALAQMAAAVWSKESAVELGFKRLLTYVASRRYGNRWSDTMAVPLEPEPIEFAEKHL